MMLLVHFLSPQAALSSHPFCATPFVPSSSSVQTEERLLIFVQEKKRKSCIDCKVLCGIVFPTKSIVVILPSLHYATCLIISLEVAKTNKLESHFDAALIYINVEYTNHDISLSRFYVKRLIRLEIWKSMFKEIILLFYYCINSLIKLHPGYLY